MLFYVKLYYAMLSYDILCHAVLCLYSAYCVFLPAQYVSVCLCHISLFLCSLLVRSFASFAAVALYLFSLES